jgi:uncharacterized protein
MTVELPQVTLEKYNRLITIVQEMGEVVIAMSGGVDSVLLARVANDVLGEKSLAITADSPSFSRRELKEAIQIANKVGIRHQVLPTDEINNPQYAINPTDRCYLCKSELFDQLEFIKSKTGAKWVVFGENADDQDDYRPGTVAASDHNVRAPLREAGITKTEVRMISRFLNLPNWNKPASACLASRIPYGERITAEKLAQIEAAENYLVDCGFIGMRVRHHGEIARIEVLPDQMGKIIESANLINKEFQKLGFRFVTLDLAGYRRGSFDEGLIPIKDL